MPICAIMRPEIYNAVPLIEGFSIEKVLTLECVGKRLGHPSKRTIIRKLNSLGCRASYSHAGKYYTLDKEAKYTHDGIWSFNEIHFSKYGTLVNTIVHLVTHSEEGYLASELRSLLHVRVHNALAKLHASKRLTRERMAGEYLYLSPGCNALQLDKRRQRIQKRLISDESATQAPIQHMIEENMCFLISNLNERQKRLYLGLESIKVGRGGDVRISQITGVNVKTIARGRRELRSKDVTQDRIRRVGAGRPAIKKNRGD